MEENGQYRTFKGSRQPESRGVRNVLICPNLSRTAAIDVLFSINFAVVFDFMYFRFRPSKAKWIGDVLTNRQNAANYLQRFLHCPPLHIWIAASILKTERYSLRHYTDATMPLAPLGNAQQFFTLCRALPKNADCLSAPISNAHYKGGKKPAAFRLIGRTMPIHFALLGRKRK